MTCKGYDAKAVKISKSVKRAAALIIDSHLRGSFLRSFTKIQTEQARGARKDSK